MNEHGHGRGARCTRAWIRELEANGRTLGRRILVICSESAMRDDLMEQRAWDAYKAAGHRLLNDRPMSFPRQSREDAARGGVAAMRVVTARRAFDPKYDARFRANRRKGGETTQARRARDPEFDIQVRRGGSKGGRLGAERGTSGWTRVAALRRSNPEYDARFRKKQREGRAT